MPVVIISGHGTIETAVAAIKRALMISSRSPSRPTVLFTSCGARSKPLV